MEKYNIEFTVFTPTFNRAHTLIQVYESLRIQTFRDFEWIVVDDGSSDDTLMLVKSWQQSSDFPIRYFYQENKGKHVAHNRGVEATRGKFFLVLDSDDRCVPEALERLKFHWDAIPDNKKHLYSGVTVLSKDNTGKIVGDKFNGIIDENPYKLCLKGEKWGFHRTEILREFPFPVFEGEKFIAEGTVWNRVGVHYLVRHVDEPLRVYLPIAEGLSAKSVKLRVENPKGTILYYSEYASLPIGMKRRILAYANMIRFLLHANSGWRVIKNEVFSKKISFAAILVGISAYCFDHGGELMQLIRNIRKIRKSA